MPQKEINELGATIIKELLFSSLLIASCVEAALTNDLGDDLTPGTGKSVPISHALALALDYQMKDVDATSFSSNSENSTSQYSSTTALSTTALLNLDLSYKLDQVPLVEQTPEKVELASFALISRAEEEIANITSRRNPRVEVGFEKRDKSSTDGTSSYHGEEISLVGWWPIGYDGHAFVHVDRINIDAGKLPNNQDAYLYGKLGAKQFIPIAPVAQRAEGTSLAAGYVGDGLRWDLGVVGIGFPVHNFVGGIRKSGEIDKLDYALEFSRRPQTSSLLSYAGAHDPATGETWGGVTNTAISGRVAKSFDQIYTFASAEYGLLRGKNVLDNNRLAIRIGVDKDYIHQDDLRLNIGLTLSYWRFKENLSNYTFGHGGYYSPQHYTSISLPVEWIGRKNKLSYLLRGSVNLSQSQEKDMNYYPTDNALQNASAPGFSVYSGISGNGSGYALRLAGEYQATQHLAVGGRADIERSAFYEPNTLLIYVKYTLEPQLGPVSFPPTAVKPYSQF